jgi:UDP-glucuronate decarboxylase
MHMQAHQFINAEILVTGGAGFIGRHLCNALLATGSRVVCLDNFSTSSPEALRRLQLDPRFALLRQDVSEQIDCNPDYIFNLACPASPFHYARTPVQTIQASVSGSLNLLELARRCGARILQASTSEVYGDPEVHPQPETYHGNVDPCGPRACYVEAKRCAETLFVAYHQQYGVPIRIARIFNTYGPGMAIDDGRVVSNFIVQALKGEALTLHGDGSQTRSFCFVSDLITGMLSLMLADDSVTCPVNLGNPSECSMADLARRIIISTSSRSTLRFLPALADDPQRRRPDISRAGHLLGWQPQVSIAEGLEVTIADFADALAQRRSATE